MLSQQQPTDESGFGGQPSACTDDNDTLEVPILIIGGGPSGLLQSYLLARLGIRSLIVERYLERLGAPKAHALSPRSLEICRQFGIDVGAIRRLGSPRKDALWVNFLTNLSGSTVGILPYERMDAAVLDATPEMIHNIPQPVFENLIATYLAKEENADIRKGVSFVSLDQTGKGVTTLVEERTTGRRFEIRSSYVIACDGARSKVRDHLKIECEGEHSYETMMTIHFNADLRSIVGRRVGMLHWLFDPIAAGFIIAYDLSGNAVLISNFDSALHPVESWNNELCRQVLAGALGRDDIQPKILSYRPWVLSRKVANAYRSGRVFLAGDAAHSFPPTGGLGLNSGLADVHNLAFKIASVLHGHAPPTSSLLGTYHSERRHVADVNSRQSVKNGKAIFGLLKALGAAGYGTDLNAARQNLFKTINDPSKQAEIQAGVEEQREHFDNLNLHIGYIYGDTSIPAHASHFKAQFVSGSRLPHAWIKPMNDQRSINNLVPVDLSFMSAELSAAEIEDRKYSTLDLCAYDAFTLIIPPSSSVTCNNPNTGSQYDSINLMRTNLESAIPDVKINIYQLDCDFQLISESSGQSWLQDSGMLEGGSLLVRPDQHILKRFGKLATGNDIIKALKDFLGRI